MKGFSQDAVKPAGNGTEEHPYEIQSINHLYWVAENSNSWNKHFIQLEDINASVTSEWHAGKGFSPIGDSVTFFSGVYNGNGHEIDKLYINRPSQKGVGFFGFIKGSQARVENLGLTDIDITGNIKTAGLAGEVKGATIRKCYVTGNVTDNSSAGGIIGVNLYAEVSDCYSKVDVYTKTGTAGGFVGINAGEITHCYSTGNVSGAYDIGGFAGKEKNESTIDDCFWDKEASGIVISSGGTGLSSSEMRKNRTYLSSNWDFVFETTNGTDDIWVRYKGINDGYPLLSWQNPFPVKSSLPDIVGEGMVNITKYPTALTISGDTITATTDDPLEYTEEGSHTITWVYQNANDKITKQEQQVVIRAPSKDTVTSDVSVFIYPNPLGNRLHIESGNQGIDKLTISDRFGTTKMEKNNLKSKEVIDVSMLETGLYTIQVKMNDDVFSWKVFKK
jgi:hypothetical protein